MTPLRIATWNVLADAFVKPERYPGVPPRLFEPPVRRARVVARAVEANADVLCLQEVEMPLLDALAAAMPGHERLGAPRGGRRPDGVAMFVRRSALAVGGVRALDVEGTVALVADLGELRVATVHLVWDAPDVPPAKAKGLAQIQALLPLLGAARGILCGDFNATASSEALRLARAAGWLDARGGSPIATGAANGRRFALDWLLHGPELAATPVSPVRDCAVSLPDDDEPSDHVVVAADFASSSP